MAGQYTYSMEQGTEYGSKGAFSLLQKGLSGLAGIVGSVGFGVQVGGLQGAIATPALATAIELSLAQPDEEFSDKTKYSGFDRVKKGIAGVAGLGAMIAVPLAAVCAYVDVLAADAPDFQSQPVENLLFNAVRYGVPLMVGTTQTVSLAVSGKGAIKGIDAFLQKLFVPKTTVQPEQHVEHPYGINLEEGPLEVDFALDYLASTNPPPIHGQPLEGGLVEELLSRGRESLTGADSVVAQRDLYSGVLTGELSLAPPSVRARKAEEVIPFQDRTESSLPPVLIDVSSIEVEVGDDSGTFSAAVQ